MSDRPAADDVVHLVVTDAAVEAGAAAVDPAAFCTNPWPYSSSTTKAQAREEALAVARRVLLAAVPHLTIEDDASRGGVG